MIKVSYLFKQKFLFMLLIMLALFTACSSSSNNGGDSGGGINVSSYYPVDVSPTALHESINIQFNRISGIGAEGTDACLPYYNVKIGTDDNVNNSDDLGIIEYNNSLLVRFTIKKAEDESDSTEDFPFIYYDKLTDNTQYTIWLRSDFTHCNYGVSDWTSVYAMPIPLPTQLEGVNVEQGDKHLRISWTQKQGELYSVHVDDCPAKAGQYSKWTSSLSLNSDHYIISLENNTDLYDGSSHSVCIASHNANGILDAEGESTWKVFGIDIYTADNEKASLKGKDSTEYPAKPVIKNIEGKNKRVEFTFDVVSTGDSAVSSYQAGYSSDRDGSYAYGKDIVFTQDTANAVISNLNNDQPYYIKLRAKNSADDNWVESEPVSATPKYTPVDLNDLNQYLGTAAGDFIYAEDVPHSDFWRISTSYNAGGRPNTDRLTRGKETALGNLFADAIKWYSSEMADIKTDFAWLIGDMMSQGIQANQTITPAFLQMVITSDYLDDTLVTVTLNGSDLIANNDYNLDLNHYPTVGDDSNPYTKTLFGQAAAVYRNNHYGGSGGTTYNGRYWGIPSSEVKYTIEYLPYDINAFNIIFDTNCATVNKSTGIDSDTNELYDAVNDPKKCYILTYDEANPQSGNPTEASVMGYKRGRIQEDSLLINNQQILPDQQYKILTTTKTAREMYVAFLGKDVIPVLDENNQPVTMLKAVAEYIAYQNSISPYLDGRVKLSGGVPGNTANDYAGN